MIRLRTLGTLSLQGSDGREIRDVLAQPKRVALLAYLALATPRGFHRRDTLLAIFWPDHDAEHARNSLSQSVHVLRRSLGADALLSRNADSLALDESIVWCDANAFEAAIDEGRTSQAVELYGGDLLEGFHLPSAPEFERWAESMRSRLAARYARALETFAEEREGAGDHATAVAIWRKLAARDLFSSRVALRLMRALAASGDPAAAVQHARLHERLLHDELGITPDPQIAEFVARMQSANQRGSIAPVPKDAPSSHGDASLPAMTPRLEPPASVADTPKRKGYRTTTLVLAASIFLATTLGAVLLRSATRGPSLARLPDARSPGGDSLPVAVVVQELYRRGRDAELSRNRDGLLAAKEAYLQALARDSTFALAYAGLASVYGFLADYDFAPAGPALDTARRMARRAVALDSTHADTHSALAVTLGDAHDFVGAEREFLRAIKLDQKNARAHYWYSILLVALGRGTEAAREAEIARGLYAVPPRGLIAMSWYAEWLNTGERPQLRLPIDKRRPILNAEPAEPWARSQEALEWAQAGNCDKAREEIARAEPLAPGSRRMLAPVASVYWHCGERARARAIVDAMKARPDANDHGFRIALAYIEFGWKDSAFVWLGRHHWTMGELSALSADWRLDPLRSDPRFDKLLQRAGIRN